jgi:hypothetical protein
MKRSVNVPPTSIPMEREPVIDRPLSGQLADTA